MINTSRIRIIAIGKIRKSWIKAGIDIYMKRLPNLKITEIRDSDLRKETKTIINELSNKELLITLDESGESLSSMQLAKRFIESGNRQLTFAVGGANGLSQEVNNFADWRLSLSSLTFPHEIARLLLIEQIYRAQTISLGSPYHRQ